jgi:hypothetical protein
MPTSTMQSHTATAKHYASTHSFHPEELRRQYPLSSQAKAEAHLASSNATRIPTSYAISILHLHPSFLSKAAADAKLHTLFTAASLLVALDAYKSRRSCSSSLPSRHGVTTNRVRGESMVRRCHADLSTNRATFNAPSRSAPSASSNWPGARCAV